jgi:hypothetical protein
MNESTIQVLLSAALSVVLACTFLAGAVPKLLHPRGFILAVLEYRVLPERLAWLYGRLLPPLELLLALLLLSGTAVRLAAIVQSMLLLSFLIAAGINLARGRTLDCHCFGSARKRPIGWRLLLQDGVLLAASIALAVMASAPISPEPWSVFRLLGLGQAAGPWVLLGCVALTACAVVILRLSSAGKGWFGGAEARVVSRGARRRLVHREGNRDGRPQWDGATSGLNGGSK